MDLGLFFDVMILVVLFYVQFIVLHDRYAVKIS